MIPAWHQLVPISGHVEESETARKLQLYATSIKTSVSTRLLIILILQDDLITLEKWQNDWQMSFNVKKCFIMRITHVRNPKIFDYKLGECILEETNSHPYLGVNITNNLSWSTPVSVMSLHPQIDLLVSLNVISTHVQTH